MILTGMPAVVTVLYGGKKAHQILTATRHNGIYTCGVTKSRFLTANINCSFMPVHAALQYNDLINRHHAAKPGGKQLKPKAWLNNSEASLAPRQHPGDNSYFA